jgi:hypothetical protein
MLSDWFLLKVIKYYIAELEALLWEGIVQPIISISFWRLTLLVIKRIIAIVKSSLKYFLIELPVPAMEFLYILHFARAFLTLIDFFKDRDNKNLVEVTKFLYACFKIFISLLMISFLAILLLHGMSPLGLMAYAYIKILFRIYTFSKFGISFLTLGFSYYKIKSYSNDEEHKYLEAHYRANAQKHTHILVLGTLITILLTLVSVFGMGLGPIGLAAVIGLAGLLLLLDIAKAIYFYKNPCIIEEPISGTLIQQNSLIDSSTNDYYYKKRRIHRLKNKPPEDRVYLLKETVVMIVLLQDKLGKCLSIRYNFFSEKPKIQKKILGLSYILYSLLIKDTKDTKETESLLQKVIDALEEDRKKLDETANCKTLINEIKPIKLLNEVKNKHKNLKNWVDFRKIMNQLDVLSDEQKDLNLEKDSLFSQNFLSSFFRKKGNCADILQAYEQHISKETEESAINRNLHLLK